MWNCESDGVINIYRRTNDRFMQRFERRALAPQTSGGATHSSSRVRLLVCAHTCFVCIRDSLCISVRVCVFVCAHRMYLNKHMNYGSQRSVLNLLGRRLKLCGNNHQYFCSCSCFHSQYCRVNNAGYSSSRLVWVLSSIHQRLDGVRSQISPCSFPLVRVGAQSTTASSR